MTSQELNRTVNHARIALHNGSWDPSQHPREPPTGRFCYAGGGGGSSPVSTSSAGQTAPAATAQPSPSRKDMIKAEHGLENFEQTLEQESLSANGLSHETYAKGQKMLDDFAKMGIDSADVERWRARFARYESTAPSAEAKPTSSHPTPSAPAQKPAPTPKTAPAPNVDTARIAQLNKADEGLNAMEQQLMREANSPDGLSYDSYMKAGKMLEDYTRMGADPKAVDSWRRKFSSWGGTY